MHFLLLMQVLERYKSQNLQRVCHFEVNKAQIKTGIRCMEYSPTFKLEFVVIVGQYSIHRASGLYTPSSTGGVMFHVLF